MEFKAKVRYRRSRRTVQVVSWVISVFLLVSCSPIIGTYMAIPAFEQEPNQSRRVPPPSPIELTRGGRVVYKKMNMNSTATTFDLTTYGTWTNKGDTISITFPVFLGSTLFVYGASSKSDTLMPADSNTYRFKYVKTK
jgi:hypothetical protein